MGQRKKTKVLGGITTTIMWREHSFLLFHFLKIFVFFMNLFFICVLQCFEIQEFFLQSSSIQFLLVCCLAPFVLLLGPIVLLFGFSQVLAWVLLHCCLTFGLLFNFSWVIVQSQYLEFPIVVQHLQHYYLTQCYSTHLQA